MQACIEHKMPPFPAAPPPHPLAARPSLAKSLLVTDSRPRTPPCIHFETDKTIRETEATFVTL
jgi:hypothetical protein